MISKLKRVASIAVTLRVLTHTLFRVEFKPSAHMVGLDTFISLPGIGMFTGDLVRQFQRKGTYTTRYIQSYITIDW